MAVHVAVDLGASGGRVVAATVAADGSIPLHEVHRFTNGPVRRDGHLRWDLSRLVDEVRAGLAMVPDATSIGIDTWAVDYGLIDEQGRLLGEPIAYRDDRTDAVQDEVHALVDPAELFGINGLQHLPFTTLYQLVAETHEAHWSEVARAVLLPDLIAHALTGELRTEVTNASTTGLLDVRTGAWSTDLFQRLGLPPDLFPPLDEPGDLRGHTPDGTPVRTVGSHDTASAVVAVPATTDRFAYISSGTWSLVGMELSGPVLSEVARDAGPRRVDQRALGVGEVVAQGLQVLHQVAYGVVGRVALPAIAEFFAECQRFVVGHFQRIDVVAKPGHGALDQQVVGHGQPAEQHGCCLA